MNETNENVPVPESPKSVLETMDPVLLEQIKQELRKKAVAMLNDAVQRDSFGLAALISVRVPVSKDLVDNTKAVCTVTPDGAMLGTVGLLNGVLDEVLGLRVAGQWANRTNALTGAQETVLIGFCAYDVKPKKEKSDV